MEQHNLETLAQLIARGGGMNEFYGPVHIYKYLWMGQYSSDPSTTGWTTAMAGRFWYNSTALRFKWWNGSEIVDIRRIFVSSSDPTPSDGVDGDLWVKYTP